MHHYSDKVPALEDNREGQAQGTEGLEGQAQDTADSGNVCQNLLLSILLTILSNMLLTNYTQLSKHDIEREAGTTECTSKCTIDNTVDHTIDNTVDHIEHTGERIAELFNIPHAS